MGWVKDLRKLCNEIDLGFLYYYHRAIMLWAVHYDLVYILFSSCHTISIVLLNVLVTIYCTQNLPIISVQNIQ